MTEGRNHRRLERLIKLQLSRPWLFILVAFLLGGASVPLIVGVGPIDGLTLNSDFTALLPESAQSVRDMDEIRERFGGQAAMNVTFEADNIEGVRTFIRELAPRVEAMEELKVVAVDWNLSDFETFVRANRQLYAEVDDLEEIRDSLRERLDYERAHANPFFLDLDEHSPPDPEVVLRRIESEATATQDEMQTRFPEGFFQHPTRHLILMVVHTTIRGGATEDTSALVAAIEHEIEEIDPEAHAVGMDIRFGGTLIDVQDETESLVAAVQEATLLTVGLVMLAIFLFFLRIRPLPLLTLTLTPPLLITFGFAELTVDYLNASNAFLSSIVLGNGINSNVIWLARYFELRRSGEDLEGALSGAHRGTWKGTLTASLAAGLAYGSLIFTDYRGFRDFGIVGGIGMVVCWLSAYLLLPPLAVVFERWRPLRFTRTKGHKGFYGVLFARLSLTSPKTVLALSMVTTLGLGILVGWAVASNPMEHDFRKLRSERDPNSDVEQVLASSREILDETTSGSALAVLAPDHDSVSMFREQLRGYQESHPRSTGEVKSIDDLLPVDQEAKISVLAELREVMLEVRPHLDEETQALIDENLPDAQIAVLTPDSLPRSVARPFAERDGTRGRLMFIEHHPDRNSWDGAYLTEWAEAARSLREPGATEPPPIAGMAVIFADLQATIWQDGPQAIGIAFLATILLLVITFRRARDRWLTLGALLMGILWMAGTMALFEIRLNFLNFLAFPITFGNGVDYGVNVMRRYVEEAKERGESKGAIRAAVEGTGGAVILCSLTTVIGYISLYTSSNQALNSFGSAMAISEVTCLFAAVLVLPAAIYVFSRKVSPTSAPSSESGSESTDASAASV